MDDRTVQALLMSLRIRQHKAELQWRELDDLGVPDDNMECRDLWVRAETLAETIALIEETAGLFHIVIGD